MLITGRATYPDKDSSVTGGEYTPPERRVAVSESGSDDYRAVDYHLAVAGGHETGTVDAAGYHRTVAGVRRATMAVWACTRSASPHYQSTSSQAVQSTSRPGLKTRHQFAKHPPAAWGTLDCPCCAIDYVVI
ncbi:hypothetical protein J6590_036199 [Homalodisca vitripennis]|nr:hypothetical protein J6590_036199 [Homalodisca vitripennis]